MTEQTFTIKQIQEKAQSVLMRHDDEFVKIDSLIAALKKPQFAEGQVFYHSSPGGVRPQYDVYCHDGGYDTTPSSRPLTLTEHGPAVRALREAMIRVRDEHPTQYGLWARISRDALAAFDEAIHD